MKGERWDRKKKNEKTNQQQFEDKETCQQMERKKSVSLFIDRERERRENPGLWLDDGQTENFFSQIPNYKDRIFLITQKISENLIR